METLTQDDEARYRALCERVRAWHQERGIPFTYPPATEEQVRQTEAELGVSLPPLLRILYTEVANGGNLLPRHDPFFGVGDRQPDTFIDDFGRTIGRMSRSGWRLHPCMAQALERFPGHIVFSDGRPEGFLTLSLELGWTALEYDLPTGRIWLTRPGPEIPSEDPSEDLGRLTEIEYAASSLEECLNVTLDRTLYTHNRAGREISDKDFESFIESSCSDDARAVWRGLYRFSPDFFTLEEPDLDEWDSDESAFDLPDS